MIPPFLKYARKEFRKGVTAMTMTRITISLDKRVLL